MRLSIYWVLCVFLCASFAFSSDAQAQPPKLPPKSPAPPVKPSSAKTATATPSSASQASSKTPPKLDIPKLLKALQAAMKKHKVPGVGLALVRRDQVLWQGGLGYADVKRKLPVTEKTLFRVGSISKSFVSLGILRLIRQGKLRLDQPIRELVPDIKWSNPWSKTAPIRVVHLLEHTAGFDDMHFNEAYNVEDAPDIPLKQALARNPSSRRARWKPGTWFSYSNPGYGLLGYILEKKTHQPFEDFLKKEVLVPLGMPTASFRKTKQVESLLAQGYNGPQWKKAIYRFIYHRPAGSLHASPAEMARFVQLLLRRGKTHEGKSYLPAQDIERMEHPQTSLAVRKGMREGYGLGNYVSYVKGWKFYGHNGGIDGFLSCAAYNPQQDLGYVLLVNQMGPGFGKLLKRLAETIHKTFPSPRPPVAKLPKAELQRWSGTYRVLYTRNHLFRFMNAFAWLRIKVEKDHLVGQPFGLFSWGKKKSLYPLQGTGVFRRKIDPEGTHYFVEDPKRGTLLFLVGTGSSVFKRHASFWPTWIASSLLLAVFLMVSALLFFLIWGFRPRHYRGETKLPLLRVRSVPLLAVVFLFAAFFSIMGQDPLKLAKISFPSVGFFLFTVSYALCSVVGLLLALRYLQEPAISKGVRIHSLLVSIACVGFMIFCWPLIGVRFWAGW